MKNEVPNWLKVIIIVIAFVLIAYAIIWIIENRVNLFKKWKEKQGEIRKLINERANLIKKKLKLDKYAKLTFTLIKSLCIVLLGFLSHYLVVKYNYDPFNAFVISVGIIGAFYTIICMLLFNKVFGLNELQEQVELKITSTIYLIGKLEPSKILEIENQLSLKIIEAETMKRQIRLQ